MAFLIWYTRHILHIHLCLHDYFVCNYFENPCFSNTVFMVINLIIVNLSLDRFAYKESAIVQRTSRVFMDKGRHTDRTSENLWEYFENRRQPTRIASGEWHAPTPAKPLLHKTIYDIDRDYYILQGGKVGFDLKGWAKWDSRQVAQFSAEELQLQMHTSNDKVIGGKVKAVIKRRYVPAFSRKKSRICTPIPGHEEVKARTVEFINDKQEVVMTLKIHDDELAYYFAAPQKPMTLRLTLDVPANTTEDHKFDIAAHEHNQSLLQSQGGMNSKMEAQDKGSSITINRPKRKRAASIYHTFEQHLGKPLPLSIEPFSEPLKTFEPFPRLPMEIRFLVWGFARPEPRIHRLRQPEDVSRRGEYNSGFWFEGQHLSWAPPPGIVHACRESRRYATLNFYPNAPDWSGETPGGMKFFFDEEQDYLYLGCRSCSWDFCNWCRHSHDYIFSDGIRNVIVASRFDAFSILPFTYPKLREIIVLGSNDGNELIAESSLDDLQPCSEIFYWQTMNSTIFPHGPVTATIQEVHNIAVENVREYLQELYEETLERYNKVVGRQESVPAGLASRWYNRPPKPPQLPTVANVKCMEIAVTEATSKKFGFMAKKFENQSFFNGDWALA